MSKIAGETAVVNERGSTTIPTELPTLLSGPFPSGLGCMAESAGGCAKDDSSSCCARKLPVLRRRGDCAEDSPDKAGMAETVEAAVPLILWASLGLLSLHLPSAASRPMAWETSHTLTPVRVSTFWKSDPIWRGAMASGIDEQFTEG